MKNFFKAVENNKVSKVQKLLGEIQNINACNEKGQTAVFIAAKENYGEMLKILADAGADLNHKVNGETPLIKACLRGATKSAQVLIEAGADLNEKDNDGLTAVFLCFSLNQDEIAKLLIEAGVDFNVKNNQGDTPLHPACFKGKVELVKTLLEAGASVNVQNNFNETPLHLAVYKNHLEVIQILYNYDADFSAVNKLGENIFFYANKYDYYATDTLEFLVNHYKGDINSTNYYGNTALTDYVTNSQDINYVGVQIALGMDPSIKNKFNEAAADIYARKIYNYIEDYSWYENNIIKSENNSNLASQEIHMARNLIYLLNYKNIEKSKLLLEESLQLESKTAFIEELYQLIKEDLVQKTDLEKAFFEINFLIQLKKPILKTDFDEDGKKLLMDGSQKIIFINHDIQRKILPLFESLLNDEQLAEKVKPYQAQIDALKNTDFSY